ncbi:xanthine dehydrogenase family protein molybdopterin-binding subunit [Fulvivirga lutimaris]|uniref:xanthine dehydrogenase family protein molybdopterin-binding subunit n=1 Tax=Fulvivirga lutimaris TaxID=1819566 RepID=UPI0012BC7998|nr:molybdopterin cofactor-binding domain-containing protein [Fulvivirga lutimaris]MTI39162.1 xanthine dehydrogenase family protein molybdopterin-binding subunit [Fulvivirga lutimaris]
MTLIKTKYNRRSFLKVTTASTGGIILGFSWLASCSPTPEQIKQMPDEWFNINAFLKIGDNGIVTIMSPNPEIGQNVKTSMPMIVAEELDVDWKDVVVEQAGYDIQKYTRQLAGGSQSIRQGWQSLRMAGATARRMLLEATAKQWGVSADELTTAKGVISHASGKSMTYGEVASAAAGIEVPEEVKLKDPKDFKIIGQPTKNVDGPKIIKGESLFGLDYKEEGMLTAMIVHPEGFGMKLKSMDATEAKAMPGIKDVFSFTVYPEGIEKQWSDVNAFPEQVAIVGNSTWEVMKAKKALKLEWEYAEGGGESTANYVESLSELMSKDVAEPARKDGDPDAAFKNATKTVEREYSAPFLAHNTMEPMNFFANVTADKAELVGPIQTPEYLSKTIAQVLGMPEDKISIMMTRMGGGFGRRLYGNFGVEATMISKKVGAPVKLVYSREDDMTQGTYRPAYKVKYSAAIDENNNVTAVKIKGAGINGSPVFENRFPAGALDNYLSENHNLESAISTGAWRAPRSNFIAFAEQSFLDEVAETVGKDPIDFRLELFERAKSNPVGENNDYDPERYAGVLKLVKEKSNWGTEIPGVSRGVSAYYCHNSYVAQVVDVMMKDGKPRVQKVWCAIDCGIVVNPEGALNQVEGGIIDGIGHAMYSAMTFTDGVPDQKNFNEYKLIRHNEAPLEIETHFVQNGIDPTGLGEPSLPPVAAALGNAIYKATGKRLEGQPFTDYLGEAIELG